MGTPGFPEADKPGEEEVDEAAVDEEQEESGGGVGPKPDYKSGG
jgi:hypothetical protein